MATIRITFDIDINTLEHENRLMQMVADSPIRRSATAFKIDKLPERTLSRVSYAPRPYNFFEPQEEM